MNLIAKKTAIWGTNAVHLDLLLLEILSTINLSRRCEVGKKLEYSELDRLQVLVLSLIHI